MNSLTVGVLALVYFGYFLVSKRLERSAVTGPMFIVTAGLLLGPLGLNLMNWETDQGFVEFIGEITLVIVLFADASRINLRKLRQEHSIPVRLLSVGLPLSILAGAVAARLLFGMEIWLAAALGTILAPTDAALGQAVISNRRVPARIRQALNVESGLNDGIALPFLLFFLSLVGLAEGTGERGTWIRFAALQLTLGPLMGLVIGYGGAKALGWATRHDWMSTTAVRLSALALAFTAYGLADVIGGNGFIAAFVAGMLTGNMARGICDTLYEFSEAEGQLLSSLTFLLFAAVIVPLGVVALSPHIIIYALLSLTVIRMAPVALSLVGQKLRWPTILFLGWFGPRGIASIVYVLIAVSEVQVQNMEILVAAAVLTVLGSVYAHGFTATVFAERYARWVESSIGVDAVEMEPVPEVPLRFARADD